MFSKLAGGWQGTQLATNPPAHRLSKLLVKVISFTLIDLNIAQEEEEEEELGKAILFQMLSITCSQLSVILSPHVPILCWLMG